MHLRQVVDCGKDRNGRYVFRIEVSQTAEDDGGSSVDSSMSSASGASETGDVTYHSRGLGSTGSDSGTASSGQGGDVTSLLLAASTQHEATEWVSAVCEELSARVLWRAGLRCCA